MKRALIELMLGNNSELLSQLNVPTEILDKGACVGQNPEFFDGESEAAVISAKKICASCPIQQKCLTWALDNESFGIWGGTTPEERQQMNSGKSVISIEERLWIAQLRADLESSLSANDVAKLHGVTERTVFRWRNRLAA